MNSILSLIQSIELAWQIKPLPKLLPKLGYDGSPFWGYQCLYYDGHHYMFGLWCISIHWEL